MKSGSNEERNYGLSSEQISKDNSPIRGKEDLQGNELESCKLGLIGQVNSSEQFNGNDTIDDLCTNNGENSVLTTCGTDQELSSQLYSNSTINIRQNSNDQETVSVAQSSNQNSDDIIFMQFQTEFFDTLLELHHVAPAWGSHDENFYFHWKKIIGSNSLKDIHPYRLIFRCLGSSRPSVTPISILKPVLKQLDEFRKVSDSNYNGTDLDIILQNVQNNIFNNMISNNIGHSNIQYDSAGLNGNVQSNQQMGSSSHLRMNVHDDCEFNLNGHHLNIKNQNLGNNFNMHMNMPSENLNDQDVVHPSNSSFSVKDAAKYSVGMSHISGNQNLPENVLVKGHGSSPRYYSHLNGMVVDGCDNSNSSMDAYTQQMNSMTSMQNNGSIDDYVNSEKIGQGVNLTHKSNNQNNQSMQLMNDDPQNLRSSLLNIPSSNSMDKSLKSSVPFVAAFQHMQAVAAATSQNSQNMPVNAGETRKKRVRKNGEIQGVYFDKIRKLWRANWKENGRVKTKGFSVYQFGDEGARAKAIEYRKRMERELYGNGNSSCSSASRASPEDYGLRHDMKYQDFGSQVNVSYSHPLTSAALKSVTDVAGVAHLAAAAALNGMVIPNGQNAPSTHPHLNVIPQTILDA